MSRPFLRLSHPPLAPTLRRRMLLEGPRSLIGYMLDPAFRPRPAARRRPSGRAGGPCAPKVPTSGPVRRGRCGRGRPVWARLLFVTPAGLGCPCERGVRSHACTTDTHTVMHRACYRRIYGLAADLPAPLASSYLTLFPTAAARTWLVRPRSCPLTNSPLRQKLLQPGIIPPRPQEPDRVSEDQPSTRSRTRCARITSLDQRLCLAFRIPGLRGPRWRVGGRASS